MDRRTVFDYIRKKYKMLPEYPWQKYDNNTVFRHTDNKKWFVLVMEFSGLSSVLPEMPMLMWSTSR